MKKKTVKAEKKVRKINKTQGIWKAIITVVLSLFILLGIAYAVINELKAKKEAQAAAQAVKAQETVQAQQAQVQALQETQVKGKKQKASVVIYYLHATARCSNCFKIETYSKQAVEKYFAKELASNRVVYKTINFDDGVNRHFIEDYKLTTKSLVVTLVKNNREVKYKVLQGVWNYLNDEAAFHEYVKNEVNSYLKEAL